MILRGASAYLLRGCQDEEVLLCGPAGTSKTVAACQLLVDACQRYPGSRHLLCRRERSTMTDTTLVTLESVIGPTHPEVLRMSRAQRHSYSLHGSEIVAQGLDEASKSFGSAWGKIVLDEAIEVDLETWELFGRAARDPSYRRQGEAAAVCPHQRIAVTNPGPPSHWLNTRATREPASTQCRSYDDWKALYDYSSGPQTGRMRRLLSVHQDNPTFGQWVNRQFVWSPLGAKYLDSLSCMTGHRRARMLEGRWIASEGSVFPEFTAENNVVAPFHVPPEWPVWMCIDPGYDHPCGVSWNTVSPNGRLYTIAEIKVRQTDVPALAKLIIAKNLPVTRIYHDPRGDGETMTSPVRFSAQLAKEGLRSTPWPAVSGKQVEESVSAHRTAIIKGEYKVFADCVETIAEHQSWRYKRVRGGELPVGDDAFEDTANDLLDGIMGLERTKPMHKVPTLSETPPERTAAKPKMEVA